MDKSIHGERERQESNKEQKENVWLQNPRGRIKNLMNKDVSQILNMAEPSHKMWKALWFSNIGTYKRSQVSLCRTRGTVSGHWGWWNKGMKIVHVGYVLFVLGSLHGERENLEIAGEGTESKAVCFSFDLHWRMEDMETCFQVRGKVLAIVGSWINRWGQGKLMEWGSWSLIRQRAWRQGQGAESWLLHCWYFCHPWYNVS